MRRTNERLNREKERLQEENEGLRQEVADREKKVEDLGKKIEDLESQLAGRKKDSTNSSKPPFSDGPAAARRLKPARCRGRRKPGGQPGHCGRHRELVPLERVDQIVAVLPANCRHCGHSLPQQVEQANTVGGVDQAMLSFYQESLVQERPPEAGKLAKVYQEAGVGWPDGIRKRLQDVQASHDKLIVNRRAFGETEVSRLTQAVGQRTQEVRRLSDERADLLSVLRTHGALAEYAELQRLQNEETAKFSAVNQKIANLKMKGKQTDCLACVTEPRRALTFGRPGLIRPDRWPYHLLP